jgi:hypothetical protein
MKRISSRWTFIHKRLFPVVWFGFLAFFIVTAGWSMWQKDHLGIIFLAVPIAMALFGYFLFKKLLFDLVDEAWDAGDHLLFKNKGIEERVRLVDIMNVSYSVVTSPPRVTILLRTPTRLGKEITFSPPVSWVPFKKSPIIDDLIQRVDNARPH